MKMHMTTGSIFLFLLLLCSCGQKVTPSKLVVSTGFITQTNNPGGLVVSAYGPNGQVITETSLGSNTITFNLIQGKWNFYVAAWEGSTPFTGISKCGSTSVEISDKATDIPISVNSSECNTTPFKVNNTDVANANGFHPLKVLGCSHLYETSSFTTPLSSTTSSGALTSGFCNAGVDPDLVKKAKGFKVTVQGQTSSFSTGCKFSDNNSSETLNLPSNKIPLKIEIFGKEDCSDRGIVFNFKTGLGSSPFSADGSETLGHAFVPMNGGTRSHLVLPYNISWSGLSPLMSLLPKFLCDGNSLCPTPALISSGSADYYVSGHSDITLSRDERIKCSDISITNPVGLTFQGTCYEDEELKRITLETDGAADCNMQNNCYFDLAIGNGTVQRKYVRQTSTSSVQLHWTNTLYENLGVSGVQPYIADSMWGFRDGNYSSGRMGDVRSMMSPDGPFGVFGNVTCQNMLGEKLLSRYVDGGLRVFKIIAKNDNVTEIPKFLCNHGDPNTTTCESNFQKFQKVIAFRELVNGSFITRDVYRLHCDAKLGVAEFQDSEVNENDKTILSWNTQDPNYSRFTSWNTHSENERHHSQSLVALRHPGNKYSLSIVQLNKENKNGYHQEHASKSLYFGDKSSVYETVLLNEINLSTMPQAPYTGFKLFSLPGAHWQKKLSQLRVTGASDMAESRMDYAEYGNQKAFLVASDTALNLHFYNGQTWTQYQIQEGLFELPKLHFTGTGELFMAWVETTDFTTQWKGWTSVFDTTSTNFKTNLAFRDIGTRVGSIILSSSGNNLLLYWLNVGDTNLQKYSIPKTWPASPLSAPISVPTGISGTIEFNSLSAKTDPHSPDQIIGILQNDGYTKYFSLNHTTSAFTGPNNLDTFGKAELTSDGTNLSVALAYSSETKLYNWNGSSMVLSATVPNAVYANTSFNKCFKPETQTQTTCPVLLSLIDMKEPAFPQTIESMNPQVFDLRFTPSASFRNYSP